MSFKLFESDLCVLFCFTSFLSAFDICFALTKYKVKNIIKRTMVTKNKKTKSKVPRAVRA